VIAEIPRINLNQEPQVLVNQVIDFWGKQLNKVLSAKPDLILLTEACDRPYGMSREQQFKYYLQRKDQVKNFFATIAKKNHCYIVFGTKRQAQDGNWFNSNFVLDRNGIEKGVYNKNFPTIGELESGIKPSDEVPIIECDFGRIACAICYDLNFPELRLKIEKAKPDIILFSSMYHGGLVQDYWAYSCRSFFVGCIGDKAAPSEIRNPLGEVIASTTNYFSHIVANINLDSRLIHLDKNGEKLTKLKEKYNDEVTVKDPGRLGSVLITSESKKVTADQMIKEFNIEKLDDYFDRSRVIRLENLRK
jgi:predicted amidohydrolase